MRRCNSVAEISRHGRFFTLGLLACLPALIVLPGIAWAQTGPIAVTFKWTAPRTGAPVDHYNVYHIVDDAPPVLADTSADTTYVLLAVRGVAYQLQVSGVSGTGLEGPLSETSDVVFIEDLNPTTGQPPSSIVLRPNYPNPFNPETHIVYGIPAEYATEARVALEVYDMRGERVRRLDPETGAGWHTVRWDGRDDAGSPRPSGQYVVRLACGPAVQTWKMTMVK